MLRFGLSSLIVVMMPARFSYGRSSLAEVRWCSHQLHGIGILWTSALVMRTTQLVSQRNAWMASSSDQIGRSARFD